MSGNTELVKVSIEFYMRFPNEIHSDPQTFQISTRCLSTCKLSDINQLLHIGGYSFLSNFHYYDNCGYLLDVDSSLSDVISKELCGEVIDFDNGVFIWGECDYVGTTENDLFMCQETIEKYSIDLNFIPVEMEIASEEDGVISSGGQMFKFSTESGDKLNKSTMTLVKTNISSMNYYIDDIMNEKAVPLDSRHAKLVKGNGAFSDYLLVDESGLKTLEKLCKIKVPDLATENIEYPGISYTDNLENIIACYKRLAAINIAASKAEYLEGDRTCERELQFKRFIDDAVVPYLQKYSDLLEKPEVDGRQQYEPLQIEVPVGEPEVLEEVPVGFVRQNYNRIRDAVRKSYSIWITQGILLTIVKSQAQHFLRSGAVWFILWRLNFRNKLLYCLVFAYSATRHQQLADILLYATTANRPLLKVSIHILQKAAEEIDQLWASLLTRMVTVLTVGRQNRQAVEAVGAGLGWPQWLLLCLIHVVQDILLFALSLFPPVAREYRRLQHEHRQ